MRGVMIWLGVTLVERFHFVLYIFRRLSSPDRFAHAFRSRCKTRFSKKISSCVSAAKCCPSPANFMDGVCRPRPPRRHCRSRPAHVYAALASLDPGRRHGSYLRSFLSRETQNNGEASLEINEAIDHAREQEVERAQSRWPQHVRGVDMNHRRDREDSRNGIDGEIRSRRRPGSRLARAA